MNDPFHCTPLLIMERNYSFFAVYTAADTFLAFQRAGQPQ